MAYEYDRFEREDGGGSFLMGLLAGTVLGAGLGMLFAPKAGAELRTQLGDQAGKLRTTAGDTYQQATEKVGETVGDIVDKSKDAYEKARGSVTSAASGVAGSVAGATGQTGSTGSTGNNLSTPNFDSPNRS